MTDYTNAKDVKTESVTGISITTFQTQGRKPIVKWEYPEFQCLCPVSERHDQGNVIIEYLPNKKILESKSVREYLSAWRNRKTWQEYATDEIADTLYKACKAKWLVVEVEWASRGGIYSTTTSKRGDFTELNSSDRS